MTRLVLFGGVALLAVAAIFYGLTGSLRERADERVEAAGGLVSMAQWLETNGAMEAAGYLDCPSSTAGLGRTNCGEVVAPGRYLTFDFTRTNGEPVVSTRFIDVRVGELQTFFSLIAPGYPQVMDFDEDGDLDLVLPREGHPAIWRQDEDVFRPVPIDVEPARSI
jgi:hypothetical protein